MQNLGAKEAAEQIRSVIVADHMQRVDPEQVHQIKYVAEVCSHLGLDASAENVHHVAAVLREHDIALHAGNQYPMWVVRKWDGTSHVANDEAEADAIINAEPLAPVSLAPSETITGRPPEAIDIDLQDMVPKVADAKHPAGRAPDEQTNRAASQDPNALKMVDRDQVKVEQPDDPPTDTKARKRPM